MGKNDHFGFDYAQSCKYFSHISYDAVFPIPDIGIGIHRNGIAQRVAREWWQIAAEATMVGMPTTGM